MTAKEQAFQILEEVRKQTDGIAAYNYDKVNINLAKYIIDKIWHHASDAEYWCEVKIEIERL